MQARVRAAGTWPIAGPRGSKRVRIAGLPHSCRNACRQLIELSMANVELLEITTSAFHLQISPSGMEIGTSAEVHQGLQS